MNNNADNNEVPEIYDQDNNSSGLIEAGEYDFMTEQIIEENKIKISLFPSRRKKTKKVNVVIEGEFNISTVQAVKENCQKLLQHFDLICITIKNVDEVDLAAIQLLHVLDLLSKSMQKTITVESDLSKDDKALIISSGLIDVMSKRK
jgi:ABC-type transporter Mla MlaB component